MRVVLLPALLSGGRGVKRCSELIVARTLHRSCAVWRQGCLGYVNMIPKKLEKKRHELCEARAHAIKSKISHRDHLTVLPKIHILIFRETRDTPHKHTCTAHHKIEAVITDDRSRPPLEQLASSVHRGPATRSWCGPLLLVLISGVVMLVFSACCLMSRFLCEFRGRNTKHRKY